MIIGLRGGHSPNCIGAVGIVKEYESMKDLYWYVKKFLEAQGHTVIDCNSTAYSEQAELSEGIKKAKDAGVDLFISLHMNSHSTGHGVEAWNYSPSQTTAEAIGNRFCANVSALGISNRGMKYSTTLRELKELACDSLVLELLFCTSEKDVAVWNNNSWDTWGRLVANAIDTNIPLNSEDYKKVHVGKYINVKPFNKTFQVFKDDSSWELWNRQTLLGSEDGLSVKILDNLRNHVYKVSHPYGEGYCYVSDLVNNFTVTDIPAFRTGAPNPQPVEKLYKIVADGVQKTNMCSRKWLIGIIDEALDNNAKEIIVTKVQG